MREHADADQKLRLILVGDLDVASVGTLTERLAELKAEERPIRLDLSELAFIDSSGLQALLVALSDARWTGWPVEVAAQLSPSVERAVRIVGIAQVLWPEGPGAPQLDATASRTGSSDAHRRFS